MRRLAALAAALVAVSACSAAAADGLRARVAPAPGSLSSRVWTPAITVTKGGKPAAARLVLQIRKGPMRRSFAARAVRRGSYRVRVAFPADGRWQWSLAAGRSVLARGAVSVSAPVRFELPYDIANDPAGGFYFLDRGRVLHWNAATRKVRVHATTSSEELVGLARLADGTMVATDLPGSRILRIGAQGSVSTLARVPAPVDIVADAAGTTLWAASLENGIYRVDVTGGAVQRIDDAVNPHGVDRDAAGNLYVGDGHTVVRIDAGTGARTTLAAVDGVKLLVAPDRSIYTITGSPSGGRVLRIAPDGTVTPVVGTGTLGPHADGRALDARILPSTLQLAPDGTLLVGQVDPVPAIRRVDLAAGTISTVVRG